MVDLLRPLTGGDAEDQAQRLVTVHFDVASILTAGSARLSATTRADPQVIAHLEVVRRVVDRCLWLRAAGRPASHPSVEEYLQSRMGHERTELVRIVFVDTRCRVIGDETMWKGTIDREHLYAREVISRALDFGAAGFLIVHNHPSGDARPSESDLKATDDLAKASATMGLKLHDHLIVTAGDRFSMRRAGLLA